MVAVFMFAPRHAMSGITRLVLLTGTMTEAQSVSANELSPNFASAFREQKIDAPRPKTHGPRERRRFPIRR